MHPKTGSRSQIAWIFLLQNVHLITKYLLSEKNNLLTSLQGEIKGGGRLKAPSPASFVWQKAQPFKG